MSQKTVSVVLAAIVAILFNTALACVKDASPPLTRFMNSLLGHNWTTQGIADLLLFLGLALIFSKTSIAKNMNGNRLASALIWSVVVASVSLVTWYIFF